MAPQLTARPTTSAVPAIDPQEHDQEHGLLDERRVAEHRREGDRLRQAVEDDRRRAEGDQRDPRDLPGRVEEAARERPPEDRRPVERIGILVVHRDAARLGGRRRRHDAVDREPVQRPEPDRERLARGEPLVAAELRHQGERQHRVPDEHHGQRPVAGDRDELEPDEEHEPDHGRPHPDGGRELGDAPSRGSPSVRSAQASMSWIVANGSTHSHTGREQRGQDRHADPAVDPQEQRSRPTPPRSRRRCPGRRSRPSRSARRPAGRSGSRPGRGRRDPAASGPPACPARARTRTTGRRWSRHPRGRRPAAAGSGRRCRGCGPRRRPARRARPAARAARPPRRATDRRPVRPSDGVHADRATPRGFGAGRRPPRRRRAGGRSRSGAGRREVEEAGAAGAADGAGVGATDGAVGRRGDRRRGRGGRGCRRGRRGRRRFGRRQRRGRELDRERELRRARCRRRRPTPRST